MKKEALLDLEQGEHFPGGIVVVLPLNVAKKIIGVPRRWSVWQAVII